MAAIAAQRRPLGALGRMSLVAAIHVAVLFAIARSLGIGGPPIEERMEATIEQVERPPVELPPPPPEYVASTNQNVVLPDVPTDLEFEQPDVITGPPPDVPFIPDPPVAQPPAQIVGVRPDPRHPLSKPEYSARMIREGNEGTIEVEVYVMPNGRVADARVVKSTGFAELDLAAIAEAKRNWRLLPATRDGVPYAQWHKLRVTFKLNEQR